MVDESSSGVGADAADDAAPDGDELAARLANVVFVWGRAFTSGAAPAASPSNSRSPRWMSRSARIALDVPCDAAP